MAPRVTVIIPTYNWSTVLPYSIGSVLDQTFDDFELLVVGDGCTDDSGEVVSRVGDPRVRWINAPRHGHQSGPNNEGLRQARGELIAYLGHDDLWMPYHLAAAVAAIDAGADVTHAVVLVVGAGGHPNRAMVPRAPGTWMPPSAVVHRRRVTDTIGGWGDYRTLSLDPEVDLWRRAAGAGFAFTAVPRLAVVKFSAVERRNVYRERPSHEQAAWLARIRTEPDLAAVELARLVIALLQPPRDSALKAGIRRAVRPINPRYWLSRLRDRNGGRIRAAQRFKGIDLEERTR